MSNPLLNPASEAPRLALRPREAAKALGVSERTLWTMTQRGDVPHVRVGRAVLYPTAKLQAWLDAQTVTTPAATPAANGGAV